MKNFIYFLFPCNRFPTDVDRAEQRNAAILSNDPSNTSLCIKGGSVCIYHFADTDVTGQKQKVLRRNAIPSIFPSSPHSESAADDQHSRSDPIAPGITQNDTNANAESGNHEYEMDITSDERPRVDPVELVTSANESINSIENTECREDCSDCKQKDGIIEGLRKEMSSLQSKLKSLRQITNQWRQRSYYLAKTQSKLKEAIASMKKENLIDSKIVQMLQVIIFFYFYGFIG